MKTFDIPKELIEFFDYLEKTYGTDEKFMNSKKPINSIYKAYKQLLSKPEIENEELKKLTALHYLISL